MPNYNTDLQGNFQVRPTSIIQDVLRYFLQIYKNIKNLGRVVNSLDNDNIAPQADIHHSKINFKGFDYSIIQQGETKTPIISSGLRIWIVNKEQLVPTDDIFANTGTILEGDGNIILDGGLILIS